MKLFTMQYVHHEDYGAVYEDRAVYEDPDGYDDQPILGEALVDAFRKAKLTVSEFIPLGKTVDL